MALTLIIGFCALGPGSWMFWNLVADFQPDPVSPPPADLQTAPAFQAQLVSLDGDWLFAFVVDKHLIVTDIHGENDRLVFDGETLPNISDHGLAAVSTSADGKLAAIVYLTARGAPQTSTVERLIVISLSSGTVKEPPTAGLTAYEIDWGTPALWLTTDTFLIGLRERSTLKKVAFARYHVGVPASVDVIQVDPCGVDSLAEYERGVLLMASQCEPLASRTIWAIDQGGKRLATLEEVAYFETTSNCNPFVTACPSLPELSLRTASVTGLDGFGRFYDNNWNRNYIYLNEQLVRVTDGGLADPTWKPDLALFMWREGAGTYYMDSQGHYRWWHVGEYIGKLQRCVVDKTCTGAP